METVAPEASSGHKHKEVGFSFKQSFDRLLTLQTFGAWSTQIKNTVFHCTFHLQKYWEFIFLMAKCLPCCVFFALLPLREAPWQQGFVPLLFPESLCAPGIESDKLNTHTQVLNKHQWNTFSPNFVTSSFSKWRNLNQLNPEIRHD